MPATTTVGDYLLREWLPATAPPRVKVETWQDRARNLEQHVVARLGSVRLQALTTAHLNRLYADLLAGGRVRASGGLSPTSVRRIHAMLRKAFNDAVKWGLIERNPALTADPPSAKIAQAARRRSMHTWRPEELRQFLEHVEAHRLHALWLFASSTGMRRSEVLGIRWSDIDFRAGTGQVRQTILPTGEGYGPVIEQKTSSSARTIDLDRRTLEMVVAHRERRDHDRGLLGSDWQDHGLVFPRDDGRWWNPPAISISFRRAVRSAGVPAIRLHDVRHTHASLLLRAGVNPKVVSERLGHSSVAFTLDTYAHVLPGMQRDAAELFMSLVYDEGEQASTGNGDER